MNIIGIDYRGYGHSEGKPSEEGIKADTEVRKKCYLIGVGMKAFEENLEFD